MVKAAKAKEIGFGIKAPEKECDDYNCPFHGSLSVRGRIFVGKVVSAKMHKSVTVEWQRVRKIPKFERMEVRHSKIKAHNPPCINAKEGMTVKLMECRPLSKTKNFVVVEAY